MCAFEPSQERFSMLVLTRQRDQIIMIGDDVEITVVDIRGDKVRLGITAPVSVKVYRREVYDQIREENRAAAQMVPADLVNIPATPPPPAPVAIEPQRATFPRLAAESRDPSMQAAIDEALLGLSEGGLPIGSVLGRGNQIIGGGHDA